MYQLEICAGSVRSALAAWQGGADRIELCDNMAEGGTTPSYGAIRICKNLLDIPVFPIIRPRGGDFLYTDEEFEVMKADIVVCKELGCGGIVTGILKADGSIDKERTALLIALARPMQVTFHRAFDRCKDLTNGLEDIISLGCERVLTSGGGVKAPDASDIIRQLVVQAGKRIIVMPGSGITEDNIAELVRFTGASEYHSTAKTLAGSDMIFETKSPVAEADAACLLQETDRKKVEQMKRVLFQYEKYSDRLS